ncbi:hypothetical protein [Ralstonia sp. 24A2]|uniref:hypothetical protein n=1 Tax=Ralstonia sp. 24A2 TaxID=3447364 RepID=UPI003F69FEF5
MELLVRIWKDPVWSKVISVAIIAATGSFWAHYEGYFTWATTQAGLAAVWAFLNAEIYMTRLLLLPWVAVSGATGALYMRAHLTRVNGTKLPASEAVATVEQKSYLTDVLFGFKWRWKAARSGVVYDIKMYCPLCDYELLPTAFEGAVGAKMRCRCAKCDYYAETPYPTELIQNVKLEVERKLRTGEWERAQS